MPHTDFCSNIKGFPYSGRAELFGLVHLQIKIISCVWVTAKMCEKDNEATGEQGKMQFLQAKAFRGDVTGMTGPKWEHEEMIWFGKWNQTKENIPDREKMVKVKSLPGVREELKLCGVRV